MSYATVSYMLGTDSFFFNDTATTEIYTLSLHDALPIFDEQAYARLAHTTETRAAGLREAAGDRPIQVQTVPGLLTVFFTSEPVRDYAAAQAADHDAYATWCRALLARGVYAPPSAYEAWFPSLAHTAEHVEQTVEVAAAAFAELAELS